MRPSREGLKRRREEGVSNAQFACSLIAISNTEDKENELHLSIQHLVTRRIDHENNFRREGSGED